MVILFGMTWLVFGLAAWWWRLSVWDKPDAWYYVWEYATILGGLCSFILVMVVWAWKGAPTDV